MRLVEHASALALDPTRLTRPGRRRAGDLPGAVTTMSSQAVMEAYSPPLRERCR